MWKRLPLTTRDLNLEHTLTCGQVFSWKKSGDLWTSPLKKCVVSLKEEEGFIK
jgi:hypothetical protein